jgi:CubicO group peptidase (beta-lactamase class C family)
MADLEREVRERVTTLAQRYKVPGVAAGVSLCGETFFACTGVTHVAHPLPVDPDTIFQIASCSKPFTATLVMQLVEEGALGLDDPVQKHLPDFHMPERRYDGAVTVRHLLSHRVGIDGDVLLVRPLQPSTPDGLLGAIARARQLVPPGGPRSYCNAGFSLAGRLVETLRGRTFAEVLRERITGPLAMSHSFTRADEAIVHRVAMRHRSSPGHEPTPLLDGGWRSGWESPPVDAPAGGILSSAADLLRWLEFWLGRCDAGVEAPLRPESRAAMCEDQLEPWNPISGQALGWEVRTDPSARVLNHGGLRPGYCSYTLFVPSLDLAAVVLTNATTGARVHVELTRWLVGELGGRAWVHPEPLPVQPRLTGYTGAFWGAFGTTHVREVDGELELTTVRHATDDGSWQPPPEPPVRIRLCSAVLGVATAPEVSRGALLDFDPDASPPAWLRFGGRISVRV